MAKKTNLKRRRKEYKKDGYYKDYEERRKNAGKNARIRYKKIRRQVKKFVRKNTEYGNRTRFLMVALVMARYNLSYRGMVEELDWNSMQRRRLGFSRTPSKSCLWWNRNRLPTNLLDELLAFTAGAGASGTLLADSSSYACNRYEWKETAKGGKWVRSTIKHHVLLTLGGCVASSAVTDGSRDDSPMLLKLTGTIPAGSGYLLADSKYCCMENCQEALRIGRLPCMRPPKHHTGGGFSAWARMIRWEKEKPGGFYRKFGMRNLVESGFSSLKNAFRDSIRAGTPRMQVRELALRSIAHNIFH